jgi:hypothetical protein
MGDAISLLSMKNIFSDSAMLWVFFFYGLGFLVLAWMVFLKKRKLVDVDLTKSFYFLGLFGLIHGITEWIDWSRLFMKINYGLQFHWLDVSKVVFLTVSFLFLLQFGINLLTLKKEKLKWIRYLPLVLGIGFFVYTLSLGILGSSELLARYGLGFSGSLLTTIGLFLIFRKTSINIHPLRVGAYLMFVAFFVYTIFGGLITFTIYGVPPQLIRMCCALLAGYASFNFLGVLEQGLGNVRGKK